MGVKTNAVLTALNMMLDKKLRRQEDEYQRQLKLKNLEDTMRKEAELSDTLYGETSARKAQNEYSKKKTEALRSLLPLEASAKLGEALINNRTIRDTLDNWEANANQRSIANALDVEMKKATINKIKSEAIRPFLALLGRRTQNTTASAPNTSISIGGGDNAKAISDLQNYQAKLLSEITANNKAMSDPMIIPDFLSNFKENNRRLIDEYDTVNAIVERLRNGDNTDRLNKMVDDGLSGIVGQITSLTQRIKEKIGKSAKAEKSAKTEKTKEAEQKKEAVTKEVSKAKAENGNKKDKEVPGLIPPAGGSLRQLPSRGELWRRYGYQYYPN